MCTMKNSGKSEFLGSTQKGGKRGIGRADSELGALDNMGDGDRRRMGAWKGRGPTANLPLESPSEINQIYESQELLEQQG